MNLVNLWFPQLLDSVSDLQKTSCPSRPKRYSSIEQYDNRSSTADFRFVGDGSKVENRDGSKVNWDFRGRSQKGPIKSIIFSNEAERWIHGVACFDARRWLSNGTSAEEHSACAQAHTPSTAASWSTLRSLPTGTI